MNDGVHDGPSPAAEVGGGRPPIRLALLDEHGLDIAALTRWLERRAPDVDLVAAEDEWARFVQHPGFPSDAVVLDAAPTGPVSLAARVRACRATGAAVVLLSREESPEAASLDVVTVSLGAAGSDEFAQLADTVREAVAENGLRRFASALPLPRLSDGERRALRLYAAGATTAEAARQMGVGYETVKTYLRRVRAKYAKLGRPASRRAELVRRAVEDGFLD